MCKKLRTDTKGTKQVTAIHVGKLETTNPYGRTVPWEKSIKNLMRDFDFSDIQVKSVLEKAKSSFKITDGENEKYNKAWNFFKKELMMC